MYVTYIRAAPFPWLLFHGPFKLDVVKFNRF